MKNKACNLLQTLVTQTGGRLRVSTRGVPHIVIDELQVSICYFARANKYRVFFPYGVFDQPQSRLDFNMLDEVIQHIRERRAAEV